MRAGYASVDITPEPGLTLSGFAARRNRPSTGVHDPLTLHALALEGDGARALIFVFDLLAIGRPLLERLDAALDRSIGERFPARSRIVCCTHTHSAPAAIKLIGCGIEDDGYWRLLAERAVEAAGRAQAHLEEATMSVARASLPGMNFNRHIVLRDGRVVMARHDPALVAKSGPGWDELLFVRFDGASGPIAALLHWAGHPTTACTELISGDYPAELCRALGAREHLPFFFLQGAAGNVSIPFRAMTFEDTARAVADIMASLPPLRWNAAATEAAAGTDPASDADRGAGAGAEAPAAGRTAMPAAHEALPFALARRTVPLAYRRLPPRAELEQTAASMEQIARGETGDPEAVQILANILNVPPGGSPDPEMLRYIASILAQWARESARSSGRPARTCDLELTALRLGPVVLAFVAAEVFVETAHALAHSRSGVTVEVVGYTAPLVGYLPTDDALREGGYEAEYAYRFYGHPAPFELGSEPALRAAVDSAVDELLRSPSTRPHPQESRRSTS